MVAGNATYGWLETTEVEDGQYEEDAGYASYEVPVVAEAAAGGDGEVGDPFMQLQIRGELLPPFPFPDEGQKGEALGDVSAERGCVVELVAPTGREERR